ncbi:MAG: hypothetical protein PHG47_08175 [Sulfuricella sp.]|nr:hypothetical protein [Sulfuricella sp.]
MKRSPVVVVFATMLGYSNLSFPFDAKAMLDSLPAQATVIPVPSSPKTTVKPSAPEVVPTEEAIQIFKGGQPNKDELGAPAKLTTKHSQNREWAKTIPKATVSKPATAANTSTADTKQVTPPNAGAGAISPTPALDPAVIGQRRGDMTTLTNVYDTLVATCKGRYGTLESRLKQQTIRSESIAIYGGLIGTIGAVATCPHCAALASGLAGLANPMQQTFKDNSDTPTDTIAELKALSDSIKKDFDEYRALPLPQVYSGTDDDFWSKFQTRRDKLASIILSCEFYSQAAAKAGEAPAQAKDSTPAASAKPADPVAAPEK